MQIQQKQKPHYFRLSVHSLLTRLVLQDTMRPIIWGTSIIITIQAFISRFVPPSVIRGSIQEALASSLILIMRERE